MEPSPVEKHKALFSYLVRIWLTMPAQIKYKWIFYHGLLKHDKPDPAVRPHNIIHAKNWVSRPMHLFISRNLVAYHVGLDVPLLIPPLGDPAIGWPEPVNLTYSAVRKIAKVEFELPRPIERFKYLHKRIRVFARLVSSSYPAIRVRKGMVGVIDLIELERKLGYPPCRVDFCFDNIRGIKLSDIRLGNLYLQADMVASLSEGRAPVISKPSVVLHVPLCEEELPERFDPIREVKRLRELKIPANKPDDGACPCQHGGVDEKF
jgi:hypothetical protein